MINRVVYLLRIYALTVAWFMVAKAGFMLYNTAEQPLTLHNLTAVLRHGLSLDLSTALYLLIVPFLAMMVCVWWQGRGLRIVLRGYLLIVAITLALAFVADTCLYEFWKFKLDSSCLEYLSTPTEAMANVTTAYLLLRVIVFVALAGALYWTYQSQAFPSAPIARRWRPAIVETLAYVLFMPLFVIGIRGGVDESTTNIGQVYFSENQYLNHSAVNPLFSFFSSFDKTDVQQVDYNYYNTHELARLTDGLYPTDSRGADTLLTTQRPNVVIILLESAGSVFTSAGGHDDIMPRFSQLFNEGVYFSNCYANSWRTDRGTLSTLSGWPSYPTMSIMKQPDKTRHLPGIARTLLRNGYQTEYLYGGDINFTNMRSYLFGTGFKQLTWKKDYTIEEQATAQWGVRDDITFNTLFDMVTQHKGDHPFLIGYSTLSSHTPWDVPIHEIDDKVANAFRYLDHCIGDFIDRMKREKAWDNLLIVLLPDHSISHLDGQDNTLLRNHIPMLWVGGAVKEPRVVSKICNQSDLPATLLGQMGIDHSDFKYSRDVLSTTYTYPFSYHTFRNGYSIIDSTGYIFYDLNTDRLIVGQSTDNQRLVRLGKALLQLTTNDFKNL